MSDLIDTPRLKLTRFTLADAEDVFRCITPAVTRFMSWDPPAWDDYRARCEALARTADDVETQFVIRRRDTAECLGVVGVERLATPLPEIGVWMKETAHGQGFGGEAVTALAQWASANWTPEGFVYPVAVDNIASRRIAERLGGAVVATRATPKYNAVVYRIPPRP